MTDTTELIVTSPKPIFPTKQPVAAALSEILSAPQKQLIDTALAYIQEKGLYTDLPFHNLEHAQKVTKDAIQTAVKLSKNREFTQQYPEFLPQYDQLLDALIIGGLFHDAGYHENIAQAGKRHNTKFTNKEAYSIFLLQQYCEEKNIPEETVDLAAQAITVTYPFYQIKSEDTHIQKILKAADLREMGNSGYETFLQNGRSIAAEMERLNGVKPARTGFYKFNSDFLQRLLDQKSSRPEIYFGLDEGKSFYGNVEEFLKLREKQDVNYGTKKYFT